MGKDYKWMPQPFSGRESRFRCPHCGKSQSFTRYILKRDYEGYTEEKNGVVVKAVPAGTITYAGDEFGICNHKSQCGYVRYPNSDAKGTTIEPKPEAPKYFYQRSNVWNFYQEDRWRLSRLLQYLLDRMDFKTLEEMARDYCIGCLPEARICVDSDKKEYKTYTYGTIFWQIDEKGNIHRGKVMFYKDDGHREKIDDKRGAIQMMWQTLKRKRENEPDMCYFGQHLIRKYPTRPIAIVESEKTALIASCFMKQFTWLACGSINNFNAERLNFIKDTDLPIVVYPDFDGFQQWSDKVEQIAQFFPKNAIQINKSILKHGDGKQDIADILLSE